MKRNPVNPLRSSPRRPRNPLTAISRGRYVVRDFHEGRGARSRRVVVKLGSWSACADGVRPLVGRRLSSLARLAAVGAGGPPADGRQRRSWTKFRPSLGGGGPGITGVGKRCTGPRPAGLDLAVRGNRRSHISAVRRPGRCHETTSPPHRHQEIHPNRRSTPEGSGASIQYWESPKVTLCIRIDQPFCPRRLPANPFRRSRASRPATMSIDTHGELFQDCAIGDHLMSGSPDRGVVPGPARRLAAQVAAVISVPASAAPWVNAVQTWTTQASRPGGPPWA